VPVTAARFALSGETKEAESGSDGQI